MVLSGSSTIAQCSMSSRMVWAQRVNSLSHVVMSNQSSSLFSPRWLSCLPGGQKQQWNIPTYCESSVRSTCTISPGNDVSSPWTMLWCISEWLHSTWIFLRVGGGPEQPIAITDVSQRRKSMLNKQNDWRMKDDDFFLWAGKDGNERNTKDCGTWESLYQSQFAGLVVTVGVLFSEGPTGSPAIENMIVVVCWRQSW